MGLIMAKEISKVEDPYEAEYDLDTLIRAEEIKKDKKKMKAVKKAATKRKEALKNITMDSVMKDDKY